MSSVPQPAKQTPMPSPVRRETVVMGRGDYLSVVLRLIGVELYKIRRRTMSAVLCAVGIPIIIVSFLVVALITFTISSAPASSFLPPPCSAYGDRAPVGCLEGQPGQADLAKAEQARQAQVEGSSESLRVPASISLSSQILQFVGLILIGTLAGTIVGGEYSVGTIRLMFTRGPTRTQFLLAKIGAILVCTVIGFLGGIFIGVATGALLNLFTGIGINFSFFTGAWLLHLTLHLLASALGLFMYGIVALFLSTLGRATAAGVAGALVWWVLESILGQVFGLAGTQVSGMFGDILKAVPNYFIGTNVSALVQNQAQFVFGGAPSPLSDLHALLVLAAYLILLIGLSWWVTTSRDVTN